MNSSASLARSSRTDPTAELHLALSCLMIAAGGVLLGVQMDASGSLHGTCYSSFGLGALVALFATALQAKRAGSLPRDLVSMHSALCGFAGIVFAVSAVLVPAGSWLFFEVLLLLWILARGRSQTQTAGPEISTGAVIALALMFLFRLWITSQASSGHFEVLSLDVPVVSSIPLEILDPLKTVAVGTFTAEELCLPPDVGLEFQVTTALWSLGLALCVVGLWWRTNAAREHENDRIHATIQTLPPQVAVLVEKLLPEEDWQALGLHGLSERMRCKRIEALVQRKIQERHEFEAALRRVPLLEQTNVGGFAGEIQSALQKHKPPEGTS